MEIRVKKHYDIDEMEEMIDQYEKDYHSVHRLKRRVLDEGCHNYEIMDHLMIWLTLIKNRQNVNLPQDILTLETTFELEYVETHTYPGFEMSKFLTPKRLEILHEIKRNPGKSIKELAQQLKRDYKNVYDDIQALAQFELVILMKSGKSRIPWLPAEVIEILI
jgi:hypothetical protein